MSISDQAFIRAYHEDRAPPALRRWLRSMLAWDQSFRHRMQSFQSLRQKRNRRRSARNRTPRATPSRPCRKLILLTARDKPSRRTEKRRSSLDQSAKATLSSLLGLAAAPTPAAISACPALEVDAVVWPPICETLLARYGERFDRMAVELCREAGSGQKTTAITGIRRGEGRTTLALCLARRLAAGHAKVVLVDADFSNPSMAAQLCIDVDRGWEAVLDDTETVWDVND